YRAEAGGSTPKRPAPSATLDRHAAGYFDHCSVDVARLVGREPRVSVGYLLRPAETAHRHLFLDRFEDLLGDRVEDRGGDESRADRVRADALAAELPRPGLDHADDAELGRGVVRLPEVAVEADDRGGIEDAARILLQHDVDHRFGAVVDALEVDV